MVDKSIRVYEKGAGVMTEQFRTNSDETFDNFIEYARELYKTHGYITWSYEAGTTRTPTQSNALHLYCDRWATALNDAGYDMKLVLEKLSKDGEIPWSKMTFKERIWKVIQKSLTDKTSTTEPTRVEYIEIAEVLNKIMAENFGVHVAWPSKEEQASNVV